MFRNTNIPNLLGKTPDQTAWAVMANHLFKTDSQRKVFVIAGTEDLRALLPRLDLKVIDSGASIFLLQKNVCYALYLRRQLDKTICFFFNPLTPDALKQSDRAIAISQLIIATLNDFFMDIQLIHNMLTTHELPAKKSWSQLSALDFMHYCTLYSDGLLKKISSNKIQSFSKELLKAVMHPTYLLIDHDLAYQLQLEEFIQQHYKKLLGLDDKKLLALKNAMQGLSLQSDRLAPVYDIELNEQQAKLVINLKNASRFKQNGFFTAESMYQYNGFLTNHHHAESTFKSNANIEIVSNDATSQVHFNFHAKTNLPKLIHYLENYSLDSTPQKLAMQTFCQEALRIIKNDPSLKQTSSGRPSLAIERMSTEIANIFKSIGLYNFALAETVAMHTSAYQFVMKFIDNDYVGSTSIASKYDFINYLLRQTVVGLNVEEGLKLYQGNHRLAFFLKHNVQPIKHERQLFMLLENFSTADAIMIVKHHQQLITNDAILEKFTCYFTGKYRLEFLLTLSDFIKSIHRLKLLLPLLEDADKVDIIVAKAKLINYDNLKAILLNLPSEYRAKLISKLPDINLDENEIYALSQHLDESDKIAFWQQMGYNISTNLFTSKRFYNALIANNASYQHIVNIFKYIPEAKHVALADLMQKRITSIEQLMAISHHGGKENLLTRFEARKDLLPGLNDVSNILIYVPSGLRLDFVKNRLDQIDNFNWLLKIVSQLDVNQRFTLIELKANLLKFAFQIIKIASYIPEKEIFTFIASLKNLRVKEGVDLASLLGLIPEAKHADFLTAIKDKIDLSEQDEHPSCIVKVLTSLPAEAQLPFLEPFLDTAGFINIFNDILFALENKEDRLVLIKKLAPQFDAEKIGGVFALLAREFPQDAAVLENKSRTLMEPVNSLNLAQAFIAKFVSTKLEKDFSLNLFNFVEIEADTNNDIQAQPSPQKSWRFW